MFTREYIFNRSIFQPAMLVLPEGRLGLAWKSTADQTNSSHWWIHGMIPWLASRFPKKKHTTAVLVVLVDGFLYFLKCLAPEKRVKKSRTQSTKKRKFFPISFVVLFASPFSLMNTKHSAPAKRMGSTCAWGRFDELFYGRAKSKENKEMRCLMNGPSPKEKCISKDPRSIFLLLLFWIFRWDVYL